MSCNDQNCSCCKKKKEEFKKGYKDGREGNPCRPSSIDYLEGYREGEDVREIAKENEARRKAMSRGLESSPI